MSSTTTFLTVSGLGGLILLLAVFSTTAEPVQVAAIMVALLCVTLILLHPFWGLFLLIFFIQLGGVIHHFAPSVSNWALEALAVLIALGVIINAPQRPRQSRWGPDSATFRMGVLFILAASVSALFGAFPDAAGQGLLKLISLLVLLYLVILMAQTVQQVKLLLLAIMLSTVVSAGLIEFSHLIGRPLLVNPDEAAYARQAGAATVSATTAANTMLIAVAMGAVLALRLPQWRVPGLLIAAIGATGIILTYTRSASMLLVVLLVWLAIRFRKSRYLPPVAILAMVLGIALLPLVPELLWQRLAELTDPTTDWTLGRRLGYHIIGLDLFAQHPLFGVGPESYPLHYLDYEYRWVEGRRLIARNLHNMYLQVAAENGLVGLLLFLGMLGTAISGLYRITKKSIDPELQALAEAVLAGYIIFLIAAATLPAVTNKYVWIMTGLAAAIIAIAHRTARQQSPP